ncbi:hypothetical protein DY000_02016119 [Brassica cretica]|uniref:Uncharacterized protein n=1 Tax=Brassica cretica TaxID=69181 RepID=A0ABQ7DC30_BRACR|nr:hypothetical protein DY000_02016119 [Brassica cretica]
MDSSPTSVQIQCIRQHVPREFLMIKLEDRIKVVGQSISTSVSTCVIACRVGRERRASVQSVRSSGRGSSMSSLSDVRGSIRYTASRSVCTVHPGTVHLDTIHHASIDAIDTVHLASIDTVHPMSIDTVLPPRIDTVHPPLIDTVHLRLIDTVHPLLIDTVYPPWIDTVHPDITENVEVLILKVDENGMLRDEEGRPRNIVGQLINAQGVVIPDVIVVVEMIDFEMSRECWEDIERAFYYKFLDDVEATREKEKSNKGDMLIESWQIKREDLIPRQLVNYIMAEDDEQHGSGELIRVEEADISDTRSASINTTASTSTTTTTSKSIATSTIDRRRLL